MGPLKDFAQFFEELQKGIIRLRFLGAIGIVIMVFSLFTMMAIEASSQSEFCGTACHEMEPEYVTWQTSGHKHVQCAECHEKDGVVGTVKSKMQGARETVAHITGNYETPITLSNPNDVNCYSCHQDKMKQNVEMAAATRNPHTGKHFENGMNCLTCHSGVVHDEVANKTLPSRDRCFTCHLDDMSKLTNSTAFAYSAR